MKFTLQNVMFFHINTSRPQELEVNLTLDVGYLAWGWIYNPSLKV